MTFTRALDVLPALVRRVRARAMSDDGVALIEVLVSALLLALIVIGTLTAFDAAGRYTTDQQIRAQASALAQQDEDRLRGLQVSQLSGLNSSRAVTLNLTHFTVTSTAQFVSDSTGTSSCSQNGTADYIKTTSSVDWQGRGSRPLVTAESLVTPSAGGSLIVNVVDRNSNPVSGMTVSGSGASTLSGTTGSAGCAVFGGAAPGAYNVTVSQTGYVDKDGNSSPPPSQQATTVVAQSTDTMSFQYDLAGSISATFDTKYGGVVHPSGDNTTLVIGNAGMTLPSVRSVGTNNLYSTTVAGSNLFPFTAAYTAFAGSCKGASAGQGDAPSQWGQPSDPAVTVTPGATVPLLIHLPALLVTVYSGTASVPGAVVSHPHVVLYDYNCGGSPPTQGGSPPVEWAPATTTTGTLVDPGQPYGRYAVCADTGGKYTLLLSATNNDPVNGVTAKLYMNGGYAGGTGSNGTGVCT